VPASLGCSTSVTRDAVVISCNRMFSKPTMAIVSSSVTSLKRARFPLA
jgi:hypothetical protein